MMLARQQLATRSGDFSELAYCRSQDPDRTLEREANVFGAELLMPEAAVRNVWTATEDTSAVAACFEVSALAAQWRLYSFALTERPGVH